MREDGNGGRRGLKDSSDDVGTDGCAGAEDGCCISPHESTYVIVAAHTTGT